MQVLEKSVGSSLNFAFNLRRIFIVNFEHISHLFFSVFIVDFEQVHVSWAAFSRFSSHLVLRDLVSFVQF